LPRATEKALKSPPAILYDEASIREHDMIRPHHWVLCLALAGCLGTAPAQQNPSPGWHTPPDQWKEPRIYHVPFDADYAGRIRFGTAPARDLPGKVFSPNDAYWLAVEPPDTVKPGPWNTVVTLFTERDPALTVTLLDHASYPVTAAWVNEKLVSIRVWWGRVRGADLLVDAEQGRIVWKETFIWGQTLFEQYHPGITPPPARISPLPALAEAPPTGTPPPPPRLPLAEALKRADKFVQSRGLDLAGRHIGAAQLQYDDRDRKEAYWLIVWAWDSPRLGGEYTLWIYMDGDIVEHRLGP
jgi:hypothetical protein